MRMKEPIWLKILKVILISAGVGLIAGVYTATSFLAGIGEFGIGAMAIGIGLYVK